MGRGPLSRLAIVGQFVLAGGEITIQTELKTIEQQLRVLRQEQQALGDVARDVLSQKDSPQHGMEESVEGDALPFNATHEVTEIATSLEKLTAQLNHEVTRPHSPFPNHVPLQRTSSWRSPERL